LGYSSPTNADFGLKPFNQYRDNNPSLKASLKAGVNHMIRASRDFRDRDGTVFYIPDFRNYLLKKSTKYFIIGRHAFLKK